MEFFDLTAGRSAVLDRTLASLAWKNFSSTRVGDILGEVYWPPFALSTKNKVLLSGLRASRAGRDGSIEGFASAARKNLESLSLVVETALLAPDTRRLGTRDGDISACVRMPTVLFFGLEISNPVCVRALSLEAAPDIARGLAAVVAPAEPGVDGDSVPMRDLRAAVRGVMLPLAAGVDVSSRTGDLVELKGSRRTATAGEPGAEPASLGVKGLFVDRNFELRAGVIGLPLECLSMGIIGCCACRDFSR